MLGTVSNVEKLVGVNAQRIRSVYVKVWLLRDEGSACRGAGGADKGLAESPRRIDVYGDGPSTKSTTMESMVNIIIRPHNCEITF